MVDAQSMTNEGGPRGAWLPCGPRQIVVLSRSEARALLMAGQKALDLARAYGGYGDRSDRGE